MTQMPNILTLPLEHRRQVANWLCALAHEYLEEARELFDEDEDDSDLECGEALEAQGNALSAAAALLVPEDES